MALSPCVLGYGEIGRCLAGDPKTVTDGNRYASWIEMYAGDEYQAVCSDAAAQLDRLGAARGAEARFESLSATFAQATRLEFAFWEMGWAKRHDG